MSETLAKILTAPDKGFPLQEIFLNHDLLKESVGAWRYAQEIQARPLRERVKAIVSPVGYEATTTILAINALHLGLYSSKVPQDDVYLYSEVVFLIGFEAGSQEAAVALASPLATQLARVGATPNTRIGPKRILWGLSLESIKEIVRAGATVNLFDKSDPIESFIKTLK